MKSIKLFLLGMFLLANQLFGQKYFFKQEYAPKSEYEMIMNMNGNIDMKMNIKGKKGEIKNSEIKMQMNININTKDKKQDKIPFVMEYKTFEMKMKMDGKEVNMNENPLKMLKIMGEIENGNQFKGLEVEGGDQIAKAVLEKQLSQMSQYAVEFPKEGMNVGESFVHRVPYAMDVLQGIDANMEMAITYTLKKVEGNIAYFDTKTMANIDAKTEHIVMNIIGNGDGVAELDMNVNQFSKMDSDIKMKAKLDMGKEGDAEILYDIKSKMQTKKLK